MVNPKNCTFSRILAVLSEGVGGFKKKFQEHNINVSRGKINEALGEGGIFSQHNIVFKHYYLVKNNSLSKEYVSNSINLNLVCVMLEKYFKYCYICIYTTDLVMHIYTQQSAETLKRFRPNFYQNPVVCVVVYSPAAAVCNQVFIHHTGLFFVFIFYNSSLELNF